MHNALPTFQRLMSVVIAALDGVRANLDILVFTSSWNKQIMLLRRLLERSCKAKIFKS